MVCLMPGVIVFLVAFPLIFGGMPGILRVIRRWSIVFSIILARVTSSIVSHLIILSFGCLIREYLIRLVDFFKLLLFALIKIRVELLGQGLIAVLNSFRRGGVADVEDLIVVLMGIEGLGEV